MLLVYIVLHLQAVTKKVAYKILRAILPPLLKVTYAGL